MADIPGLVQERDKEYKGAWLVTGMMIAVHPVRVAYSNMLQNHPQYTYAWMIILNKLVRVLANPTHLDSWKDIAGYATLVVNHLEQKDKKENV